jgi:exodeoxyribonuclease VII small subunit
MASTRTPNDWNYETAIASIEQMINKIESGDLPLETVFEEFELAVQEINQCEQFLNQGTKKMELLIETLEDMEEEF